MTNNKQIPFRYPEELEEDIDLIIKSLRGSYENCSKNQAIINAVKMTSTLIRKIKSKSKKEISDYDIKNRIIKLISCKPGEEGQTLTQVYESLK